METLGRQHWGPRQGKGATGFARSETPYIHENFMRKNWESLVVPTEGVGKPQREVQGRKPMQRATRQSDEGKVPTKSANKTGQPEAELMEGRPSAKGKAKQGPRPGRRAGTMTWMRPWSAYVKS